MQRAIKSKPLTATEIKERIHTYIEVARPFVKIHIGLMTTQVKKMVFHPTGRLEIQYTDEYYILKKQIDQTLDYLQKSILIEGSI